jgi:hypothetical protein
LRPAAGAAPPAGVTLHSGKELQLECAGDLGPRNAGLLVFAAGAPHPEYVPWIGVGQVALDQPSAMYPPPAGVTLHGGKELQLECAGDLGPRNAGLLVFAAGAPHPEYVPWTGVGHVALDQPSAMYPPPARR